MVRLRIRVFLLLLPLFFFFTNHNCSHPEIRILFFSKSRSIPSATTQKHPNPLSSHLTAHKSTFHFFSQSLDLHSQLTQIAIPKPDLSSKGFNWCCWLVVAAQRSGWGEKKIRWCRWRGKKQMGTKKKKEEDGDALCEKKKKKKGKERKEKRWKWVVWNFLKYKGGLTKIYKITNLPFNISIGYYILPSL